MPDEKESVLDNDVRVTAEWTEQINEAQKTATVLIQGRQVPRVRYGEEKDNWGAESRPCHDCGVVKGQFHVLGCDVERCPVCGGQLISCDCSDEELTDGDRLPVD